MDLAGKRAWTRNLLLFDPFLSCPMANQENGRKAVWSPHFLLKWQKKAPNRSIFMIVWRTGWAWGFAAGRSYRAEPTQQARRRPACLPGACRRLPQALPACLPARGLPQALPQACRACRRPDANAALHLGPFRIFNDLCGALHFEMRSISQRARSTTLTP